VNIKRLWIRRDREIYFLTGVILACSVGGFVSAYWHFTDRITVHQNIKLRETAPTKVQQAKLREVQYTPTKLRTGATQYYRLDDYSKPSVPKMGEDESN
jgi:hypothetical protein